jgi:hypothetical protein
MVGKEIRPIRIVVIIIVIMALMIKENWRCLKHTTYGVVSGTVDQNTSCTGQAGTDEMACAGARVLSNMGCELRSIDEGIMKARPDGTRRRHWACSSIRREPGGFGAVPRIVSPGNSLREGKTTVLPS